MVFAPLALAVLALEVSISRFEFEGATVRALHVRDDKSPFVVASVEGCPSAAASPEPELGPSARVLISSTHGTCSAAFLNRLRSDISNRKPSAWSSVRAQVLRECSMSDRVIGAEPHQSFPETRSVIPRECLAVEFRDSRTAKAVALLASGPLAATPRISADIETRFRQQGFGMTVILLPANSPDVKAKSEDLPYSVQVALGLLRDVQQSRRKPVERLTLESEGPLALLRVDSLVLLAVPAVPSGFLQRYLGRHLGLRRDFLLTNAGTMPEVVAFNGLAPGIQPEGLAVAFAAGRLFGRDPMRPVAPPTEDLRSSLQKANSGGWTLKLCGPATAGVQGKYGAGARIVQEGRIAAEPATAAKRNAKSDATIAFWVHPTSDGKTYAMCRPGNLLQGFGLSLSVTETCGVRSGRSEKVADLAPAGWTHVVVRIKGGDLTGSVQIDGKKRVSIRRPSAGDARWIVGGAGSALLVSDFAMWDKTLRDDFVPFLIDGAVPKWIYASGKGDMYPAPIEPNTYEPPATYPPD